ncbi:LysE family translocator [Rhizobiaceae bacterium]|nr:LysE family translocator [Rhizobiaceae bacterium]
MSATTFYALLLFSFVSSITPGPNNIMLFSSGLNFGMWRTLPHMLGISIGFGVLLLAIAVGLGAFIETFPVLLLAIKIAGGGYMLYLAYRIATSGPVEVREGTATPMSFLAAAAFQWVNPKAWVMATVAMATYTTEGEYWRDVAIVIFAFVVINFPSVSVWAGFGTALRSVLRDPFWLRVFNGTMAALLVASLYPMLQ